MRARRMRDPGRKRAGCSPTTHTSSAGMSAGLRGGPWLDRRLSSASGSAQCLSAIVRARNPRARAPSPALYRSDQSYAALTVKFTSLVTVLPAALSVILISSRYSPSGKLASGTSMPPGHRELRRVERRRQVRRVDGLRVRLVEELLGAAFLAVEVVFHHQVRLARRSRGPRCRPGRTSRALVLLEDPCRRPGSSSCAPNTNGRSRASSGFGAAVSTLTLSVTMMLLVASSPFQKSGTVTCVLSTPDLGDRVLRRLFAAAAPSSRRRRRRCRASAMNTRFSLPPRQRPRRGHEMNVVPGVLDLLRLRIGLRRRVDDAHVHRDVGRRRALDVERRTARTSAAPATSGRTA